MKSTKKSLFTSALALFLCFSMLLGTTFAWFTDTVTSSGNKIASGSLKVDLELFDKETGTWNSIKNSKKAIFDHKNWEPGYTEVKVLRITNKGSLSLKWDASIVPMDELTALADVIDVYIYSGDTAPNARPGRNKLEEEGYLKSGTLRDFAEGLDAEAAAALLPGESDYIGIALKMRESAGNEYKNASCGEFDIRIVATQYSAESEKDSFDENYDNNAQFPVFKSADVNLSVQTSNGIVTADAYKKTGNASIAVSAGTKTTSDRLGLTVSEMASSGSNIKLEENEILRPLDVHVEGVAADNTKPIIITLDEAMMTGLNIGNYKLYHVEGGASKLMTAVTSLSELDAHNEFYYDPATGNVTLAMATFSEVAIVAEPSKWEGNRDYSWYTNAVAPVDGEAVTEYVIANADQLAAFSAIVGGMDGQTQDSFSGKTVKLTSDINLGDKESENNPDVIFYPIGYYNSEGTYEKTNTAIASGFKTFEGTFDGNGHTISNFYQNTWEMKGDHNWYDAALQYYRDGMGLFGKVYGGTVKNLTVSNFSSDGEITTTGVIAAYADGATFENIAITNCNPRVYNIGNGGIVGCVGWYAKEADLKTTFTNITVDNSNKISALWGSYDVACGGIVGQYYPTSGQSSASYPANAGIHFENCHVAAQMDVYNDVCANYQYYAYRYAGMIIGSIRKNTTNEDGKTIPDMTGISAKGCTVNYGDWNDYYYCEFEKNSMASYSEDYQFSRVPHSELNFTDSNGNGVVDAEERASVTGCKHTHTAEENHQAVYLPFHQLFTGYGWGVSSIGLEKYSGIVTNLDITEGEQQESATKFETKFTGDFLYRVGNQNEVKLDSLFEAKDDATISSAGTWVTIEKIDDNMNVSGKFTANTSDWTQGTIQFSGTGVVKVTIQDYNFCIPTVLYLEVVDAANLTSATGTTTGGNFVLLCDVNTITYVNYWNCTLYGNGFTYSLNGAPTAYNSKQGHGILITKNATLDNLVIVGDVYNSYGAYTNQDYYNAAVDVVGDTTIQNCYISGCAAPVSTRANATIINTTLYGGTVANLIIKSGTVTLEDVTTANYDDGRSLVGMGIVIHSDATEAAKLVLNGTLTQYNFVSESKVPTDSYAKNLHTTMFGSSCSKYHFGTSPNRYVNAGIVSLTALFNAEDITDNANTSYAGTSVTVNSVNGYVYTQPNTSGSINNNCPEYKPTTQGAVPPSYSFDYTSKNYVAKADGSNDYCYEENGIVNISMDAGDTFNWDTSILTIGKGITNYTVSMNGTDYTEKSIAFNTNGEYKVVYTYTDANNYKLDENGDITTYSVTYTETVSIVVAVVEAATKHAEFIMGTSNAATEKITIDNTTYISATGVTADNSTWTYITINGQKIYYPIIAAKLTSTKGSSTYAYFPVFENAITITDYADNGTGDAFTYNSSTTTLPSTLTAVKGIYKAASDVPYWYNLTNSNLTYSGASKIFKWASSSDAPSDPTTYSNVLCYKSPQVSADRVAYITLVQYSYTDAANTTYYYYVGYTLEAFTKQTTCVTPDTLVTLADGTQVRVDALIGNEMLLVWNHQTGTMESVPVAYIVNHDGVASECEVISLNFSNGRTVKIIGEHVFFDATLNKYVAVTSENANEFIGHKFAAIGADGNALEMVELSSIDRTIEITTVYEVVSYKHLTCFTEGILSTSAYLDPLLNVFDINEDTLAYDAELVQKDIEAYGLYTYADFEDLISEEAFELYNAAYLKIAVGKGYITWDDILNLINIYFKAEVQPL